DDADFSSVVAGADVVEPGGQALEQSGPDAEIGAESPVIGAVPEPAQHLTQELCRRCACEETRQYQDRMPVTAGPARHLARGPAGGDEFADGAPLSSQQRVTRRQRGVSIG